MVYFFTCIFLFLLFFLTMYVFIYLFLQKKTVQCATVSVQQFFLIIIIISFLSCLTVIRAQGGRSRAHLTLFNRSDCRLFVKNIKRAWCLCAVA